MPAPLKPWPASWTGSAATDLLLGGSPTLAILFGLSGATLPGTLLLSGLQHSLWAALACVLLAGAGAPEAARLCLCRGPLAPRRLRFTEDGQYRLDLAGGRSESVQLAPRSVISGPWLLLVLDGSTRRHRVVVDRWATEADVFAALVRSLRRVAAGTAGPRRALLSPIDPSGSGPACKELERPVTK